MYVHTYIPGAGLLLTRRRRVHTTAVLSRYRAGTRGGCIGWMRAGVHGQVLCETRSVRHVRVRSDHVQSTSRARPDMSGAHPEHIQITSRLQSMSGHIRSTSGARQSARHGAGLPRCMDRPSEKSATPESRPSCRLSTAECRLPIRDDRVWVEAGGPFGCCS